MTGDAGPTITRLCAEDIAAHRRELAALLHACVHAGASVGFVLPFTREEAAAFWQQQVQPAVRAGTRILLVARRRGGGIAGSVQLGCATPPNQPHRGEVSKLLVDPGARRRGVATALMAELERVARRRGRSLITLDTRTGDTAEALYAGLGYTPAGVIPGYCRDPFGDGLDSTTIMYKALA